MPRLKLVIGHESGSSSPMRPWLRPRQTRADSANPGLVAEDESCFVVPPT
jgi:hypothetical protein